MGKAFKYGDNVDTDAIIPSKYLHLTDPKELSKHALEGLDPTFSKRVRRGDVIIAGKNFGCGSSREHAVLALKYTGIAGIVAESFARIFFRNAINLGLPVLECPNITTKVKDGDEVEIDYSKGIIKNLSTGEVISAKPLPEFIINIIKDGGLIPHIKKRLHKL